MVTVMTAAEQYTPIPNEVFRTGFEDELTLPQGSRIYLSVKEDSIVLESLDHRRADIDHAWFELDAEILRGCPERTMTFEPVLEHPLAEPVRHPELSGSSLFRQVVTYFDRQSPVICLQGTWQEKHVAHQRNLSEYFRKLPQQREITDTDRQLAAFNSWTGRQALKHNFTEVTIAHGRDVRLGYYVQPLFRRPQ